MPARCWCRAGQGADPHPGWAFAGGRPTSWRRPAGRQDARAPANRRWSTTSRRRPAASALGEGRNAQQWMGETPGRWDRAGRAGGAARGRTRSCGYDLVRDSTRVALAVMFDFVADTGGWRRGGELTTTAWMKEVPGRPTMRPWAPDWRRLHWCASQDAGVPMDACWPLASPAPAANDPPAARELFHGGHADRDDRAILRGNCASSRSELAKRARSRCRGADAQEEGINMTADAFGGMVQAWAPDLMGAWSRCGWRCAARERRG